ncbi:hypothetical protein MKW94_013459 [Papaver nudicaule]|uniref:Glycosyltransferases n=1 Tax=Papaver nudicaule TaxID=74823 RepID=A0AA41RLS9_PAPNU|nr:hypothetical protein [Papaver nudicaule]
MASIRRTLSPMTRPGHNGDVLHPGSSPLSKSVSYTLKEPVMMVTTFSDFVNTFPVLYRIKCILFSVFSKRASWTLERSKSKPKRHIWRNSCVHFIICFVFGMVMGLFSLVEQSAFPLDVRSSSGNASIDYLIEEAFPLDVRSFSGNASIDNPIVETFPLDVHSSSGNASIDTPIKEVFPLNVLSSSGNVSIDAPTEEIGGRYFDISKLIKNDTVLVPRKLLIIVTTTYTWPFQAYYLNRLAHTLSFVPPPMVWIVVEMSSQTSETSNILRKTGIMYRHLVCDKNLTDIKKGGIHQKNVALSHIEKHQLDGITFFADEGNMYSVELFEQMRDIRRFGTWPVAMLTENRAILEGPVCNGTQISGWQTNERIGRIRKFHVSMSGFAFNSTIIWDPKRWHRPALEPIRQLEKVKEDFQVSAFIEQLVEDESQMECIINCSKIMVWHLHMEASSPLYPHGWVINKNLDENTLIN